MNWASNPHSSVGKAVSIPVFANKTFKPNLESALANAVIDQFAKSSGFRVARSANADMTLSGEVVSYSTTAVAYSSIDNVTEYKAFMRLVATLRRNSNQQVLWKGELSWDQTYPANQSIALQENAENAAIEEICRRLALEMYLKIVQNF